MAGSPTLLPEPRLGSTLRRDAWWIEILPVIIVLGGFGVYATFRAIANAYYSWGPYLSPFSSPLFDPQYHWWPFSPALLILAGPLGFRATCYYYRKAYYRAFFLDPPACAVGESPNRKYRGETAFPFILQNVHRYFFYLAVVLASGSARSSSPLTSVFFRSTPFPATRCVTLPAASSTAFPARHLAAPVLKPGAFLAS